MKAEKKKEDAKLLDSIPRNFSAEECGAGVKNVYSKKHQINRQNALERIKLRAPPLPPAIEVKWIDIHNNYCRQMAIRYKDFVGGMFVREVNALVKVMGKYLVHPKVKPSSKTTGDPKAFENFVEGLDRDRWQRQKKPQETSCSGLPSD